MEELKFIDQFLQDIESNLNNCAGTPEILINYGDDGSPYLPTEINRRAHTPPCEPHISHRKEDTMSHIKAAIYFILSLDKLIRRITHLPVHPSTGNTPDYLGYGQTDPSEPPDVNRTKLTSGLFNSVWMDYTIETTENKDLKGNGGIIGLTMKGPALTRWFMARPLTSQYSIRFRDVISQSGDKIKIHHEPFQIRWNEDVQKI
ncbi:unnamed protein product [Mytilus coruscus]|uniref:Uncharacterized protein n=1 Tax=Mytilus coruscus TaxID=42192 RepID=A0A6J8D821_MYTCO|nr:unnamed protein product [Mytilus coruscus]